MSIFKPYCPNVEYVAAFERAHALLSDKTHYFKACTIVDTLERRRITIDLAYARVRVERAITDRNG